MLIASSTSFIYPIPVDNIIGTLKAANSEINGKLVSSPDAILIDTTNLDADEVFLLAKNNVEEYLRY